MDRFRSRLLALILAVAQLGCQTWQVVGPTPAEYLADHSPRQALIQREGKPDELLQDPVLKGDSIRGFPDRGGIVAIPVSDIGRMSVRKTSWIRTLGVVALVGGGVALAALLSNCNDPRSAC